MRPTIPALACAALLSGCAPMQWVKQDATAEQAAADERECFQAAWREAGNRSYLYHDRTAPVVGPGFTVLPSGAFVDPFAYQVREEGPLAQYCMESRGYRLVPAPSTP